MKVFKRDGMEVIARALDGMRREINNLKVGADLCDSQHEANVEAIEVLSQRNAGLSAKAAGARALVKEFDSIVPVPVVE